MKKKERELVIILKNESDLDFMDDAGIYSLNAVLNKVEKSALRYRTYEIININKGKIITSPVTIKDNLRLKEPKPFIFLYNKN